MSKALLEFLVSFGFEKATMREIWRGRAAEKRRLIIFFSFLLHPQSKLLSKAAIKFGDENVGAENICPIFFPLGINLEFGQRYCSQDCSTGGNSEPLPTPQTKQNKPCPLTNPLHLLFQIKKNGEFQSWKFDIRFNLALKKRENVFCFVFTFTRSSFLEMQTSPLFE